MRIPATLDEPARPLAEMFLRLFPGWNEDGAGVECTDLGGDSFRIKVPSYFHMKGDIEIEYVGGELSIFWFAPWHEHLDLFPDSPMFAAQFAEACRSLDNLFEERMAIVNAFAGNKWIGSFDVQTNAGGGLSQEGEMLIGAYLERGATRLEVRSWRSTYNEDRIVK